MGAEIVDLVKLKAEIDDDPLSRGYDSMTDAQIRDSLNTANRTIYGFISARSLLMWMTQGDGTRWDRIQGDADDGASTSRAVSKTFIELMKSGVGLELQGRGRTMLDDLVSNSTVITAVERTQLNDLGGSETVSRATELGLGKIAERHVVAAKALP